MSALGKQSTLEALWAESQDIWHSPTSAIQTTLDALQWTVWLPRHCMYDVTRHRHPCECVLLVKCFQTELWARFALFCTFVSYSRDTSNYSQIVLELHNLSHCAVQAQSILS